MIVKGIITGKNTDNTYNVHIPIFDSSNGDAAITAATVSTAPGLFNNYKVNDVVFVGFENNVVNSAVILGKLYINNENESNRQCGALDIDSLVITGKTKLSNNTTIGNITYNDIQNMKSKLELLTPNDVIANNYDTTVSKQLVGKWNGTRNVYRTTVNGIYTLTQNVETLIATVGPIFKILDMKHFQVYQDYWYSDYYNASGNHTVVRMRVEKNTGKVYAQACNDSWNNTECTFIIDYVLVNE